MALPPIIGVCIISPSYSALGKEAVRRFKRYTGLDVRVIRCRDDEGFEKKLQLDRLFPRKKIVAFDADLWMMRPWTPECSFTIGAVHDPMVFHSDEHAFPARDCETESLDRYNYVNTGLMLLDFSHEIQRRVFQEARRSWKRKQDGKISPLDVTDQVHINVGIQKTGAPQAMLPTVLNTYLRAYEWGVLPFIPRGVIGIHAAGVPLEDKQAHLHHAVETLGGDCHVMQDAAVNFQFTKTYEWR